MLVIKAHYFMLECSKTKNRHSGKTEGNNPRFENLLSGGTPKTNVLISAFSQLSPHSQVKNNASAISNYPNPLLESKESLGSQPFIHSNRQQISDQKTIKSDHAQDRNDSPLTGKQVASKPSKWSPFEPRNVAKEDFYSFDNFINHKTVVYSDAEVKLMFQGRDQPKEQSRPQFIPNSFVPDGQSNNISNHFQQSSIPPRQNIISQKSISYVHNSKAPVKSRFNRVNDAGLSLEGEDMSEGSVIMAVGVDKLEVDYEFLKRMAPPEMQSQRDNRPSKTYNLSHSRKENPKVEKINVNHSRQHLMHDPYEEECGISFTKIESHMTYKASKAKFSPAPLISKVPAKPSRFNNKSTSMIPKPSNGSMSFSKAIPQMNLISNFEPMQPTIVDSVIIKTSELKPAKVESPTRPKGLSKIAPLRRKTADNFMIKEYFELMYSKKPPQILSEVPCHRPNSQVNHRNRLGIDPFLQFKEERLKRM